jgi:uncharacterized protein YcfJ
MMIFTPSMGLTDQYKNINGTVEDHYITTYTRVPVKEKVCRIIEKPVYGYAERQGSAAGGALLGMIIGGAVGKGVTGNNDGAAAGAIMGGIIGADQGSKPKTDRVIVGYEEQEKCAWETTYVNQPNETYSHSTITFKMNGVKYKLRFNR